jgi:hypothetical protein
MSEETEMSKTPIEMMMDGVEWVEMEADHARDFNDLPFATHSGVLTIGDYSLKCYRLSNGQAVFDGDDFENFFRGFVGG